MITKQLTPQQSLARTEISNILDRLICQRKLTHSLGKISFQVETLHLDSLIFLKRSIFERSNILDECAQDEDNVFSGRCSGR